MKDLLLLFGKNFSTLIGLAFVVLIGVGCENDLKEIQRIIAEDEIGLEVARNVEILYSDSAVVRVKVSAPRMLRHLDKSDPKMEFPDFIKVDFFGPKKQIQSVLTAKYALRHERSDEILIQDSVVWQSNQREMLETEELIWDEKKKKIYSNKFVTITKPDEIIYGYGFEANQEFTRWKINAIEGVLNVDGIKEGLE